MSIHREQERDRLAIAHRRAQRQAVAAVMMQAPGQAHFTREHRLYAALMERNGVWSNANLRIH